MHRPLTVFVPHGSELLTDHLPNGDGLVAYGLVRELAERGHTVHVAVTCARVREALPANLHVHVIRCRCKGLLGRLEFMWRMRRLYNRLRRQMRFDLLHQLNPVFTGVSLAMLGSGVPLVLGTYVARWPLEAEQSAPSLLSLPVAAVYFGVGLLQQMHADRLLLTAPAARNRLPVPRLVEKKIRPMTHGIDTQMFSPAEDAWSDRRMSREQRTPRVLFLANLSLRKGIVPLLQAWAQVVADVPDAMLTIAGDGPAMPVARDIARQLGLGESLKFLGEVPREHVTTLMREHALYALPSFGEPYAVSLQEAMSCGRPAVITDAGGVTSMAPEDGAVRVPVRDAATLAAAMVQLLRDPEMRIRMGMANRAHVLQHMTWPAVADALEDVYSEVLKNREPKRARPLWSPELAPGYKRTAPGTIPHAAMQGGR